jgi:hypothetical protein
MEKLASFVPLSLSSLIRNLLSSIAKLASLSTAALSDYSIGIDRGPVQAPQLDEHDLDATNEALGALQPPQLIAGSSHNTRELPAKVLAPDPVPKGPLNINNAPDQLQLPQCARRAASQPNLDLCCSAWLKPSSQTDP